MTPDEFRQALKTLQMNQDQAAAYLRVTQGSVSRWSTGANPVPGPIEALLEIALREQGGVEAGQ